MPGMGNVVFKEIECSDSALSHFSDELNVPVDPHYHVDHFISENFELAHKAFVILHSAYDLENETYFGFTSLRISYDIDDVPGLLAELLYLKPEYRGKLNHNTNQKYSYDLLDYIVEIGLKLQKYAAVNHIFLVPVNQKIRDEYKDYGFENLPGSGKNEFEDYMVLNLIDENMNIL